MQSLSHVRETLRHAGLQTTLHFLNDRVPHRFTAVYQLNGDLLRSVAIVDKAGEVVPEHLLAVPLGSSFCQFVLRDGFFNLHGDHDERLEGHPYQGVVESYVGVPLSRDGSVLIGTFCHFDFPPLAISDEEFVFMQQVAKELPAYVVKPGTLSGSGAASILPHLQTLREGKGR
ncbi:MAG: GAF domain-containing protein [Haliea sp.]|nr:MAG: GAF domain-containing protein [Haliea sp.]